MNSQELLISPRHRQAGSRRLMIAGWVVLFAGCEFFGRNSSTEWVDVTCGLFVIAWSLIASTVQRAMSGGLVRLLLRPVQQFLQTLSAVFSSLGVDFRQQPPFPVKFHSEWNKLLGGMVAGIWISLPFLPWVFQGLRALLVEYFYVGWLLIALVLWSSLAIMMLAQMLIVWGVLHDLLVTRYRGLKPRSVIPEVGLMFGVTIATIIAAFTIPGAVAGVLLAVLFLIQIAGESARPDDVSLVWREPISGHIFRIDSRVAGVLQYLALWLPMAVLFFMSQGETFWESGFFHSRLQLPLLHGLGRLQIWVSVATALALTWVSLRSLWLSLWMNPAREPAGMKHRPSSPDERRRLEIMARRKITSGLESLFKRAARDRARTTSGFWLGLQHWYMLGLADDGESASLKVHEATIFDQIIGWPYYRAVPHFARHHFWQMTTALEVDLIFVERGVPFRRFVRVLRMMFELYDVHGGRQRAEEHFFTGLPGLRVLILEYEVSAPPSERLTDYVELNYEQISRARILYVFKDTTADEVEADVPQDWEGLPVLSGT